MLDNNTRKGVLAVLCGVAVIAASFLFGIRSYAYSTDDHPKAEFSPDGGAFTIVEPAPENIDRTPGAPHQEFWWLVGTRVETGIAYDPVDVGEGQHLYHCSRQGMVPIMYWECLWENARCIHGDVATFNFHGIRQEELAGKCGTPYYSGWQPVCATCGDYIREQSHYMDINTVGEIQYYNVDMGYYYLCPYAPNLEQAVHKEPHECLDVSYNRYQVKYNKNAPNTFGNMYESYHMYNNATEFEGKLITPVTKLSRCTYFRIGYEFDCWTTNPDGTGDRYEDGQEIYNLTTENYNLEEGTGTITLYAQWKRVTSTLVIDGAGGRYEDGIGVYDAARGETTYADIMYGTKLPIDADANLIPPEGYMVSFNTGTDEVIEPKKSEKLFSYWKKELPFKGKFKEDIYRFVGSHESVDRLTAMYRNGSIILPTPETSPDGDLSFGGWYEDEELTQPVGSGGDEYTPKANVTLYASWVNLKLKSVTDLTVDAGKGGVDLTWTQPGAADKSFKIFQKLATAGEEDWRSLYSVDDLGEEKVKEYVYEGQEKNYIVPYTGFYTLEAFGAQGGGYESEQNGAFYGGKGGAVTAKVWLTKGDVLTVTVGGSGGYNGGGTGSDFGAGGGMTSIVSEKLGPLLIAGGGGGASATADGGAGGAEEYLREDGESCGEDGVAGSGGGYIGGTGIMESGGSVNVDTGEAVEFGCSGGMQIFTAQVDGIYTMEVWGAQGGHCLVDTSVAGGKGGYTKGDIELEAGDILYVCVGGYGLNRYGYNGGGFDGDGYGSQNGGGATHIATGNRGILKNYFHYREEVLVVAGGGGSSGCVSSGACSEYGGSGGGTNGGSGANAYRVGGSGGTQSGGGSAGMGDWNDGYAESGGFGYGGFSGSGAGGGGGWYGGGGAVEVCDSDGDWDKDLPAGGGSGHIGNVIEGTGSMTNGVKTGDGLAKISLTKVADMPGGGGSNYVCDSAVTSTSNVGVWEGDGFARITASNVGYLLAYALSDVFAHDTAAPDAVDINKVTMEESGSGAVLVIWQKPLDNGTGYNHQVISYQLGTEHEVCRSNITTNLITTGIKEYYYIYSNFDGMTVTAANKQGSITEEKLRVQIQPTETKYLYLAPVDVAGNVGATTSIKVTAAAVEWGVITDQISISSVVGTTDYGSVYHISDKNYYVKADGRTPFNLKFNSSMNGTARENYQMDNQIFDIRLEDGSKQQRFTTVLPHTSITGADSINIPVSQFERSVTGDELLKDAMNSSASRKRYSIEASFAQAFSALKEHSGKKVIVTPVAGAAYTTDEGHAEVKYSDWALDSANAVTLYLDGEAPVVNGLAPLENLNQIDRRECDIPLYVIASDVLSGLRDFYIKIYNTDNTLEKIYRPEADGSIQIEINSEQPIFCGDFMVTVYAIDNVGNEMVAEYGNTELALETTVERVLEPHAPLFRCGESGVLTVTTWGYADRVEVEFPQEMTALNPDLNRTFSYEHNPQYKQQEIVEFQIPLYTPNDATYRITVRAYKDDKVVEALPNLNTIEIQGSILDDIRTRLR